jgi:hypothetical protein
MRLSVAKTDEESCVEAAQVTCPYTTTVIATTVVVTISVG